MRNCGGTSNDGSTSRRFFAEAETSASILRIDVNLILRFRTILNAINCNQDIDVEKFEPYCAATAQLHVKEYGWYPMIPTVHKVLVHGSAIISSVSLPIGMYSEKAQESQKKMYRHNRRYHSRKMSREATNEDVMTLMLAQSDPYIYKFRKTFKAKAPNVNEDVLQLLKSIPE